MDRMKPAETLCSISHITDKYVAYPGETVRLSTRLDTGTFQVAGLSISLPPGLSLLGFNTAGCAPAGETHVLDTQDGSVLNWKFPTSLPAGKFEYFTEGTLEYCTEDTWLVSKAVASDPNGDEICSETVRIAVKAQSRYMDFLPDLYRKDELMGRFLMLFESFWKPIETQIRLGSWYFDPDLTPEKMLPWLASWVGAFWDEYLPETRQRQLLRDAVSHYQRRGTRQALQEFLEMYTGGKVSITEKPAHNFVLGEAAHLGQKVALGTQNLPHSFTVDAALPLKNFNIPENMEITMIDKIFRNKMNTIITLQKPAHTVHQLNLEVIRDGAADEKLKRREPERNLYEQ